MIKKVYVWEFPVRLTHWLNFLSITVLSITGLYIGAPYFHAIHENAFIMAKMRYWHFISAYVLTLSVLVRVYWWFMGNKYARWDQWLPVTAERFRNIIGTAKFYAFMRPSCPHSVGHTGPAGLSYLFIFILLFIEIITGFALYSQSHGGGIWTVLGGWLLGVMSQGTARLIHHGIMWIIIPFVIIHVYMSWHNDLCEKSGLTSSIFTGYKSIEE
jgi:Ni/Fe-hydrogenase 1 B-type cytochrome subunit